MRVKKIKQKTCKQCGELFTPRYSTIQPVCSPKCALEFNKPDQVEKRYQQIKEDAQPLSFYEGTARSVFQLFIRMRDKNLPCISCGTWTTQQWDGGHYFKAELFTGLIFNEINCNKQCSECNGVNMHGNLIGYRIGLVKKYGEYAVQNLEAISNEKREYKFNKFELLQIKKHYQQKIKELKSTN